MLTRLFAVLLLLVWATQTLADAGPPPPRYVEGASDARVDAQNWIVLGLILAGIPTVAGLLIARWTRHWGIRVGVVFLACNAAVVVLVVAYLGGLFITNQPPRNLRKKGPPAAAPVQPIQQERPIEE